ncbi:hypothetical protein NliqN6_0032 [Naganishia liquefaciens]|uniref:Proteasome assembly chaperone 2 n=1 Tax=Naganishia liquefaciens TaxID=104408 RepID=A0A8H3TM67_9TREE|nr:hypothetical protein NliqN6_0032 [Naganishia liquefaciens]
MSIYTGTTSLFQDAILVIPSVSQASLPQLTVDVLVHSLGLRRIGKLRDEGMVVPMVGEAEGEEGGIVTGGIEVFGREGSSFVFLQQRAPTLTSRKQDHVDLIVQFITSHPFSAVLILTSLDSAAATIEDHLYTPLQVIHPPKPLDESPLADRLGQIPRYVPPAPSSTYPPFLPCAGLTRRLLATMQDTPGPVPPHASLAYWCTEADNRDDAVRYAGVVTYLLGIPEKQVTLVQPPSWQGLFGGSSIAGATSAASDIYG